jgi:chromosome segregation ATPase
LNLTEALKFVEEHVPGSVAHKLEAAQQQLEAHKAELTRAVGQLQVVVSTSSTLSSKQAEIEAYLESLKSTILSVEATIDNLNGDVKAQPSAPAAAVDNTAKTAGLTVTQTRP